MKRIHGVLSGVAVALVAWVASGSDVIDRPLVLAVSPAGNRRSPPKTPLTTPVHSPPLHRQLPFIAIVSYGLFNLGIMRSQGVQLQGVPRQVLLEVSPPPSAAMADSAPANPQPPLLLPAPSPAFHSTKHSAR